VRPVAVTFVCLAALALSAGAGVRSSQSTISPADLVLINGRIVTLESPADAQAMASRGSRIVAVGSTADVKAHVGRGTRVIDVQGRLVIPGFVEGHGHFTAVGESRLQLNLMNAKSWKEIIAMVGHAVRQARPGQWIYGRGWHQEKWRTRPTPDVEGFPTHHALSKASPNNPVLLTHASGHASFANQRAMDLSDVHASTPDPPGGDILRDSGGNPTGVFREAASRLIRRGAGEPPLDPSKSAARARRVLELASQEVLSKGVTSFHDAGSRFEDIDLMKKMIDEGRIGNRLWAMVRAENDVLARNLPRYRTVDHADGFLTVRGIKKSIDGALGSRGAWLLHPYADKPGDTGHNTTSIEEIREAARLALEHDYQLCVHAIGDRANRQTLDIFEEAFKGRDGRRLRWRIEHAQHLHPVDIPRFGRLGIIASMQGVHCTSDAPYVIARLGTRRAEEGAYVWQKLARSGAIIANGTDAPVEDVNPIASYYATVSRKLADGSVFFGDQRLSRMDALKTYTINGAYAAFEDGSRGSLAVGKYADMVVLSKDLLTIPEDEIPSTEVIVTIVGGRVRYEAAGK